jgi:hypothetical protein
MILSKPQQEIAENPSRFKVVCAGRRFGKTYLSLREICYRARHPNKDIFYITTSYRSAKMIMWKPLRNRLMDLRWASKINESELSIQLVNGSTISLKGADDPQKLRGAALDYCVIDEGGDCKLEELWGEICRPMLADRQGGALVIGTPKGKANAFYDMYQFAQDPDNADWHTWQYRTIDGGFVAQEEIEAAKQDMSESQFRQEFLASFEDSAQRCAWAFNRETMVIPPETRDTKNIFVGMDFNVQPLVCNIAVREGDDLIVVDEIQLFAGNTDLMAQELRRRYPTSNITVFPDPSGSRSQTSSGGRSDHSILHNAGFTVKSPRKHDPVRDRINALNARFSNAAGENHLKIQKNCRQTIECLDKHQFQPGTMVPVKGGVKDYSHQFDALSYMVAYLFPIRKIPQTQQTTQKWGF